MRRIVIILISFILLSGFTVKDNITIENKIIKEDIEFLVNKTEIENCKNNSECDSIILSLLYGEMPYYFRNNSSKYYKKTIEEQDSKAKIMLSATYYYDDFKDSVFAHSCFNKFDYSNKKGKWTFSLDAPFSCREAEEISINVTTEYEIIEHNADYQDQNTLVWNFSKNTTDKSIYLNLGDKFKILSSENSSFILVIIIVIGIVAFLLYQKYKKTNEKW